MPYPVINAMLDDDFPAGSLNYWLSSFTKGLPDALIDTMVDRFASVPSPMSALLFEHFHGAVTRVPVADAAVPHRPRAGTSCSRPCGSDPAETEQNIAWTRDTHAALAEHLTRAAG